MTIALILKIAVTVAGVVFHYLYGTKFYSPVKGAIAGQINIAEIRQVLISTIAFAVYVFTILGDGASWAQWIFGFFAAGFFGVANWFKTLGQGVPPASYPRS